MRLILLLVLSVAALPQPAHQRHDPTRAAEAYAHLLERPERDSYQKPDEVVRALGLKPGEIVADIGAGTGYFARRFALQVAKVYAVDISARLLERVAEGAPANLRTILATADDPGLAEASVDTVFFCNVLHHIGNRGAYYRKLDKALKPGGRIVIVDFYKRQLPVGPSAGMKLSEKQVIAELEAAGFVRTDSFEFLLYQYFLVFRRAAEATTQ